MALPTKLFALKHRILSLDLDELAVCHTNMKPGVGPEATFTGDDLADEIVRRWNLYPFADLSALLLERNTSDA